MDCQQCREALSAGADGEDLGIDGRFVEAHLERCVACRSFSASIDHTRARFRVAPAETMPDLSPRIRKLAALSERAGRWTGVRLLLAVVAAVVIGFSVPALLFGQEHDTSAHAARHLGAFTAAYGVALLVVAVRPARARAVLPVAAVLAGALAISAVVDLVNGHVPLVNEVRHVPELASVVLVWLLAAPAWRPRSGRRHAVEGGSPELTVVRRDRDAG